MLTLLGSFIGFLGSVFPDIVKFFHAKQDKAHELNLFDKQLELFKIKSQYKIEEFRDMADVAQMQGLYSYAPKTGVRWVDALSGSVRPVLTYTFFLLYGAVKYAQFKLIAGQSVFDWKQALSMVWHEEDQALFATVVSFWFGHRALRLHKQPRSQLC